MLRTSQYSYPWGPTAVAENYAPANLGQLKAVFSFDIAYDSDGDTLPDAWELVYGSNLTVFSDPNADPDGDGVNNLNEALYGRNPLKPALPDSAGTLVRLVVYSPNL